MRIFPLRENDGPWRIECSQGSGCRVWQGGTSTPILLSSVQEVYEDIQLHTCMCLVCANDEIGLDAVSQSPGPRLYTLVLFQGQYVTPRKSSIIHCTPERQEDLKSYAKALHLQACTQKYPKS